jgi:hypothetical protein
MIKFEAEALTLSVAVVRSLLQFAGAEDGPSNLAGIGIDEGDVCATDGHAAVRFAMVEVDGCSPTRFNRRVFSREFVEKVLKASGRNGAVRLPWVHLQADYVQFPRVSSAEPKDGVSVAGMPIAWDAALLARLDGVARACRRDKVPGEVTAPCDPPVVLTTLGSSHMDAMRFMVGGEFWDTAVHRAHVTIMPMNLRAKGATSDEGAIREARKKTAKRVQDEQAKTARRGEAERRKAAKLEAARAKAVA